jgi:hypothetical protein
VIEEFSAGDPRSLASALPMPNAHGLLLRRDEAAVARLRYEVTPLGGLPTGILGQYEAADTEAGVALLREAQRRLAAAGVARVIGPMDGSTWGSYRLALPPEADDPLPDAPPFLTEPQNPPEYAAHFHAAGFTVAASYESRIAPALPPARPGAPKLAARIAAAGITVRPIDANRFDDELRALFTFSTPTFGSAPFFRPIDFAGFRALYDRLRPILDPDLVLLARDRDGHLAGFVFAIPDALTAVDGCPRRLVLKTLAVHPPMLGLGTHLADAIHSLAHEKGYASVIHALMHSGNASLPLSAHYSSKLLRRYALYEWRPSR